MRSGLPLPRTTASLRMGSQGKASSRAFSTTPTQSTRLRRNMWAWLHSKGAEYRHPTSTGPKYLALHAESTTGNHKYPFPLNKNYASDPVLSDELREAIWSKVVQEGSSVRAVSASLGVEMSRVAAVVRLKEIEKSWPKQGKKLATPYANAVLGMLPQTQYTPSKYLDHESINDLPVHASTATQIFYPTSESRHFTREDAARIFDENLMTADKRVPHPQLIEVARDRANGVDREVMKKKADARAEQEYKSRVAFEKRRKDWEAANVKKVETGRWEFRFREISVDDAGPDGRGPRGTGWRYGAPLMDRKRGQVKIPTRVL